MEKVTGDSVVFITLATTGLEENGFVPEICQLTLANEADRKPFFNKYILPKRAFQPEASEFNGFTIITGEDGKHQLMQHDKEVKIHSPDKVMNDLMKEISSIRSQVSGRIVLAGYCCQDYDIPVLRREMTKCNVSAQKLSMTDMNIVCADLYQLIRSNRSTLLPNHRGNLKMTTVYNVLCGANNPHTHDAVEDAEKLRVIYSKIRSKVDRQKFESCVFSFPCDGDDQVATESVQQQPCGALKRQNIKSEADTAHQELAIAAKKPRIK